MSPNTLHRHRLVEHLDPNQPIWFISDLHMGDGTPSDAFFGKDRHLLALIARVEAEGGVLVVNGDAIDVHQAFSFMRVLRAHREVVAAMSKLGQQGRLYYVIGNHDYDLTLFRDVMHLTVCHEIHVGEQLLVRHGYEYDPYITDMLDKGQWHTIVHHLFERVLGTWLRIPLAEFYSLPNRLMFYLGHKVGVAASWLGHLERRLDLEPMADEVLAHLDYWSWGNMGDSMGIFRPAWQDALTGPFRGVVCGHSHLPGVVRADDRFYANSGSWTFAASQFLVWDGTDISCHDWITGRTYGAELYQPMLDGTLYERDFFQWWRENYMGYLRFREGEERRHHSRSWQDFMRDHQVLALPEAVAEPPLVPRASRLPSLPRRRARPAPEPVTATLEAAGELAASAPDAPGAPPQPDTDNREVLP